MVFSKRAVNAPPVTIDAIATDVGDTSTMRFEVFALSTLAITIVACGGSRYGDAGAERQPLMQRTFDVDPSGTGMCPGEMYAYVNEMQAVCSRAPQRCYSNSPADSNTRLVCHCDGQDGGQGTWRCDEYRP